MSKWINFHTKKSPIKVADLDDGQHAILGDWNRLKSEKVVIDGQNLSSITSGEKYKFDTAANLEKFFKEIILKKIPEDKKEAALKFLLKYFHQGGLMYPVSAPLTMIFNNSKNRAMLQPAAFEDSRERELSIITTSTGFKIQEIYTVKKLYAAPLVALDYNNLDEKYKKLAKKIPEDQCFTPDSGKDFVIKAGATVDIDFSKITAFGDNAKVKVETSAISYGNSQIRKAIDLRSFVNIIIDFFKNLFGSNSIKILSEPDNVEVILPEQFNVVICSDFDGTATNIAGRYLIYSEEYRTLLTDPDIGRPCRDPRNNIRSDVQSILIERFGPYEEPFACYQRDNSGMLINKDAVAFYHAALASPNADLIIVTKNREDYVKALFEYHGFTPEEMNKLKIRSLITRKKADTLIAATDGSDSKPIKVGPETKVYVFDDNEKDYSSMLGAFELTGATIQGHRENPGAFKWETYREDLERDLEAAAASQFTESPSAPRL